MQILSEYHGVLMQGSGDSIIGRILMMEISMQIGAYFKLISWNIDAGDRVMLLWGEY